MEKQKLVSKEFNKEWEKDGKKSYIFNLVFENGDSGSIFSDDALGGEFKAGEDYDYEVVVNGKGYKNIKMKKESNGYGGGFKKSSFNPEAQIKVAVINGITNIIAADKLPIAQMEAAIQKLYNFVKAL